MNDPKSQPGSDSSKDKDKDNQGQQQKDKPKPGDTAAPIVPVYPPD